MFAPCFVAENLLWAEGPGYVFLDQDWQRQGRLLQGISHVELVSKVVILLLNKTKQAHVLLLAFVCVLVVLVVVALRILSVVNDLAHVLLQVLQVRGIQAQAFHLFLTLSVEATGWDQDVESVSWYQLKALRLF